MDNHEILSFNRTGTIVKVNFGIDNKPDYRFGVTVKTQKELVVIFKDGSYFEVIKRPVNKIEYICATYLVCEKIDSLEKMIHLLKKGVFEDAFRNMK